MSKDGSALATGSEDRAWKLFDALSGAEWVWGRGHDSLGEFPHSLESRSVYELYLSSLFVAYDRFFIVHRQSPLVPVDPSFRALSGRVEFMVRRHKFNKDNLSSSSAFASCWWAGGGGWGGVCCPLESKQASLTAYPPTPSEDASLNVSMHVGSSVSIGVRASLELTSWVVATAVATKRSGNTLHPKP